MRQIITQLRAAEGMRKGMHAIDTAREPLRADTRYSLGRACDTADRAQNPDLIARPHTAVAAAVAHERAEIPARRGAFPGTARRERVLIESCQRGCEVVRVNVRAAADVVRGATDRPPQLAHRLAGSDIPERHLMSARHRFGDLDHGSADFRARARHEVGQRNGDIVLGGDSVQDTGLESCDGHGEKKGTPTRKRFDRGLSRALPVDEATVPVERQRDFGGSRPESTGCMNWWYRITPAAATSATTIGANRNESANRRARDWT